ncbi:comEA protein [Enterococcus moraviensis ATCC BAA-383]|uniref:ComEA protein n=1 Tax=Enterococcus moraviensis ATCC BAA-383 TaxID=1158609 RepID=R2T3F4_9ENTE|nr:helix-hairpin-helix domain-containing protein [Enterococcus moraviensis]EOI01953.1 comEA protein [Enterococcus moraviensis ATCC BAA-383]EOT73512.1 hypothetical protein I586_00505 [Enterococcus moraviensis ATCC BAA-383]
MDYRKIVAQYSKFIIGGTIMMMLFGFSLFYFMNRRSNREPESELTQYSTNSSQLLETESSSGQLYVDIKGAVEKPGIYEGHLQMRVWDVVMLAGGVKDDADTKQVNFAERIKDQMVIYVPKVGEEVQHNEKSTDSQISQSDTVDKVNLNQATETELQTLSGVGQKKAQEIIRYREENGGFKSIDDLKNISGFGEKTVEKLKEFITV